MGRTELSVTGRSGVVTQLGLVNIARVPYRQVVRVNDCPLRLFVNGLLRRCGGEGGGLIGIQLCGKYSVCSCSRSLKTISPL